MDNFLSLSHLQILHILYPQVSHLASREVRTEVAEGQSTPTLPASYRPSAL